MPAIKQNREQQKALEEVSKAIEELTAINVVTSEGWNGTISVVFNTEGKRGKGGTTKVQLGKTNCKEGTAIVRLMKSYAARVGKEALAKAQKYDILLEPEEKAVLKGEAPTGIEQTPADATAEPSEAEERTPPLEAAPENAQDGMETSPLTESIPETDSLPDGLDSQQSSGSVWEDSGERDIPSDADNTGFEDALRSFQNH